MHYKKRMLIFGLSYALMWVVLARVGFWNRYPGWFSGIPAAQVAIQPLPIVMDVAPQPSHLLGAAHIGR